MSRPLLLECKDGKTFVKFKMAAVGRERRNLPAEFSRTMPGLPPYSGSSSITTSWR